MFAVRRFSADYLTLNEMGFSLKEKCIDHNNIDNDDDLSPEKTDGGGGGGETRREIN